MDESPRKEVTLARPVNDRRCLLEAERASLHLRTGEGGLAQLVEPGMVSVGLNDVDLGVGTTPFRPRWWTWRSKTGLGTAPGPERRPGPTGGAAAHTGSASPIHMPKSGSSSSTHPPGASQLTIRRSRSTGGDVHEHRSGVNEIECGRCGGPMRRHWFTVRRCDRCICLEINYLRWINARVPKDRRSRP